MDAGIKKAFRASVSGRVQMVMYRDFAQRKARALGIVGEVQNMPEGTVRVIAEGEEKKLESFAALLAKGPILARVDAVSIEWVQPSARFSSFSIAY